MATDTVTTFDADGNVLSEGSVEIPASEFNRRTIAQAARDALAANRTFLALAAPTNAQNAAQIKALTRQVNGLIRLVIGQLDATD